MVRNFFRNTSSLTFALLIGTSAWMGCSGSDSDDPGNGANNCVGCVSEGESCDFTLNCEPGSICNQPSEDLFDETRDEDICIRVICDNNGDCNEGQICGPDKLCRAPICQNNDDCSGSNVCLSGTCQGAPDASAVASCSVSTRDTALSTGGTITLGAVAKNSAGQTLGRVTFTWASSETNAVTVDGNVATGGATSGTAVLTAEVGGVNCSGDATITNFAAVAANTVRVVVVEDGVGSPVEDANVIVATAEAVNSSSTAADGSATFTAAASDVTSVTVEKDGWQLFTIIEPGVSDIFIPLPRDNDITVAGGVKGNLDLSLTRNADIRFGFAGPAIPSNLLDFGAESLIGDILPVTINAPDLGVDGTFPLPAGLIFSLSDALFTATPERCLGNTPGADELGCYLTRMAPGPSAAWALGGQVSLSDLTSLVNELSGVLGGGTADIPIGDILTGVLPLLRLFNHGLNASVDVDQNPKVPVPGQTVDCSDPGTPNYNEVCIANVTSYEDQDLQLSQPLNILSSVGMPELPLTASSTCAEGAVMLSASFVDGRGLIPLGLGAGLAVSGSDCRVAGLQEPFGRNSEALPNGRLALSMAPPHSGIEGGQTVLLGLALDIDGLIANAGSGFQVSAILNRVDRVNEQQELTGTFPAFPTGSVSKATAQVELTSSVSDITVTRAELNQGGRTWVVYAPARATVDLPDVATGRSILADANTAVLLTIKMRDGVSYGDVWTLSSGSTIDRLFDTIDEFVVTGCPEGDPNASCTLE